MGRARWTEAAQRFAERRRREDESPRLSDTAPNLVSLRIEVEERRASSPDTIDSKHVRHVVVSNAPALFVVPCGDRDCREGGHDLTEAILRALAEKATELRIEHACSGVVGNARVPCNRFVRVVATAVYR